MNSLFIASLGAQEEDYLSEKEPALIITASMAQANAAKELKRAVFGDLDLETFSYEKAKAADKNLTLEYLSKSSHSLSVLVHKKYQLILKMVNSLIGAKLKEKGQDITKDFGNIALSNLIYSGQSLVFNDDITDELYKKFIKVLTTPVDKHFEDFFTYVSTQRCGTEFDRIFKLIASASSTDRTLLKQAVKNENRPPAQDALYKLINAFKTCEKQNTFIHFCAGDPLSVKAAPWLTQDHIGEKGKIEIENSAAVQHEAAVFINDALKDCFLHDGKIADEKYHTELFNTAVKKLLLNATWPTTAVSANDFKKK